MDLEPSIERPAAILGSGEPRQGDRGNLPAPLRAEGPDPAEPGVLIVSLGCGLNKRSLCREG